MQCKFRQLFKLSEIFNFCVKAALLLRTNHLFFIIRTENNCWEVVPIVRPRKSVENAIVRVVNDEILWIFGELRFQSFQ
jgi:hypothetical protein